MTAPALLLGPATVFTPGRMVERGGVVVRDGLVAAVGAHEDLRAAHPDARPLDLGGGVLLPGFVNAHTHLYSALARGMPVPGEPASNFIEILERLWWRLDRALDPADIEVSALVTLAECVRAGVTTAIDHHSSPNACPGSLDAIRRAARAVGVRVCTCCEVSDRDGEAAARAAIEENVKLARSLRSDPEPLVRAMFGVHATFTVSEDTLGTCVRTARAEGLGLHLHVSEDRVDVERNVERHGVRPVERLARHGALGPGTLAAHCVHVDAREIDLLAESGAAVAHNPRSNMGNAVGFAPVREMLDRGVLVGLGTDGCSADMLGEMRAAIAIARHAGGDPRLGPAEARRMAFDGNARIASTIFGVRLGAIEPGAAADIVALDYDPPTPLDADNLLGHLLHGVSSRHVAATMVAGRVVFGGGRIAGLDERDLAARARERAAGLWRRL